MRVDLKKFIFIGPSSKKDDFISICQSLGSIQFFGAKVSVPDLLANDFFDVAQAIKALQHFDAEQTPHVSIVDPLSFSRMVIADKLKLEETHIELKAAREKLQTISPFGLIPLNLIREIEAKTSLHFRLWTALRKRHMENSSPHLLKIATFDTRQYFLSLTKEPISFQGLEEIPLTEEMVHISSTVHSLSEKIESLEEQLKHRATLVISLRRALIDELDAKKRQHVLENAQFPLENRLFYVTGWIPETKVASVQNISTEMDILSEEVPILKEETPPTYLENESFSRVGEDLVSIYDTPSSKDADPSMWILVFFSLFFAMIVEDAGYGIVFLITAFFLQKKLTHKSSMTKRLIKLTTILGAACIVWGVFTHSYFALELSHNNPLRTYSPLTYFVEKQAEYHLSRNDNEAIEWTKLHGAKPSSVEEFLYVSPAPNYKPFFEKFADHFLMELALLVGCLHISLSILRYIFRNILNAGWILLIIGGYLFSASYLEASSILYYFFDLDPAKSGSIGLNLAYLGLGFYLIASVCKHGITGVFEIFSAVQVFSDVLSYIRIYALALAGSLIARMTNQLADNLPFMLACIIFLFAHAVNILIAIQGGLIHGLRLNFLEWYHYSFEGGGRPFTPLKLEERL